MDCLFKTKRLLAYPATEEDIARIQDLEKKKDYHPFIHYESAADHQAQIQDPAVDLLVFKDENGNFCGFSLNIYHDTNLELRRFAVSVRGQGFGREALIANLDYVFSKDPIHRLWLDVYSDNERGLALYRSLGLRQEGYFHESELGEDGNFRDQYIFAITKPEWEKLREKMEN